MGDRIFDIEHIFNHHAPSDEQIDKYQDLRHSAKYFALSILGNCPDSADRSDAIRKVREALMIANASIALDGRLHK